MHLEIKTFRYSSLNGSLCTSNLYQPVHRVVLLKGNLALEIRTQAHESSRRASLHAVLGWLRTGEEQIALHPRRGRINHGQGGLSSEIAIGKHRRASFTTVLYAPLFSGSLAALPCKSLRPIQTIPQLTFSQSGSYHVTSSGEQMIQQ